MDPAGRTLLATIFAAALAAGCLAPDPVATAGLDLGLPAGDLLPVRLENLMTFTESIVDPAVGLFFDLYEPTMEISDTGTIYVAGHVIAAATTGTPAYYSRDDGATWEPLPFLATLQTPPPLQGSQPPPGDEGFIVAGENGQAWMVDIYLAGFSISGWCEDGARLCYDNRQAYDRVGATVANCHPLNLNDRPWAAYASGKLLLVNNAGGGAMQIGVMDVPPAQEVGVGGGPASLNGPTWNFCASEGGWIPGIPAMRADGLFAVPQMVNAGHDDQVLTVVVGNSADIFAVETKEVFPVTHVGSGTSNGGRAAFDAEGTLFVGAKNNTRGEEVVRETLRGPVKVLEPGEGRFVLAASTDGGQTFQTTTFVAGTPVRSLYVDGNMGGAGALVTWSQDGDGKGKADWYVAHAFVGPDGRPELRHAALAVDEGPPYSAHVMGAAAGPDGRAYFLTFEDKDPLEYVGTNPIRVWIQQEGPTLPAAAQP